MPHQKRLTAKETESLLLKNRFILNRSKGSHKIYKKDSQRIVIPFHSGKFLHPKIIKELFSMIEENINK